jgi:magnesium chelatase family protein
MSSRVYSGAILGLDASVIEVETDISYGLRCFSIVGLPDKAVEESKERVGAAIKSSFLKSPHQQPHRVLVNLAPADLKKEGSLYDLPIALGYLLASKQIKFNPQNKIIIGELSLDGKLRPIKGVLSLAMLAEKINFNEIILPKQNEKEASLIEKIKVIGVESLKETIDYLEGKKNILPASKGFKKFLNEQNNSFSGLAFIKGQEYAKRGLEIAAAGNHNLLMVGPPGTGKTLLAKALPEILPPLSFEESLEVTKIYSIAGLLPENKPLIQIRPFRSPHHTSSEAALLGGGTPPLPGEITLSHRGILFLDEFPEFHRDVLESLRQPIEEKIITVLRAKNRLTFPANFTLVAASNPCPCGNLNNPEKNCTCTPSQIQKYKRKMSGPLMDRIDVFVEVPAVKYEKLIEVDDENFGENIRKKVKTARQIQRERFNAEKENIMTNNEMPISQIKKYCKVDEKSQSILKKYVNSGQISARGYHRVLKMARTIADLEEKEKISFDNLMEALMYRIKEES